jgi:hypothetical protein
MTSAPFLPLGEYLVTHLLLDKGGDKARHRRRQIAPLAHQMDPGKLGLQMRD